MPRETPRVPGLMSRCRGGTRRTGPDPLEELRDGHDVMEPLLEYRRIVAQAPPFAPPEVFMAVLEGRLTPRVSDVTWSISARRGRRLLSHVALT